MALGAGARRVQFDVIAKTLRLALMVAFGNIASFAVAKAIASPLFGTTPTDPATFAGMIFSLATVALLAGYIPARRASRISPMIALRSS
jgi:ABC-type antimicrobial peptide transport system permease subunit